MLMPLLKEMPGGPKGELVSRNAVHFVLFFVACAAYGTVGIFGASIYGQATESNILVCGGQCGRVAGGRVDLATDLYPSSPLTTPTHC